MRIEALRDIENRTYRASPEYELVLFDHLPPEQQQELVELQEQPDFYGILRPKPASGRVVKTAGRDIALLLLTLQKPGNLPSYVKSLMGASLNEAITELLMDGILEVEHQGVFISGADVYALMREQNAFAGSADRQQSASAQLSVDALRYGQALHIEDANLLSTRLYAYNRIPCSSVWRQRFTDPASVAAYLGIEAGGNSRPALERGWSKLPRQTDHDGWFAWRSRRPRRTPQTQTSTYKLYASPHPDDLQRAFQTAVPVLSASAAFSFKVGCDVYGVLRPDKLVAYFEDFEGLAEAAGSLERELNGLRPHGVPFTAPITADGLLSWGVDPAGEDRTPLGPERESWRLWLTNRLAVALLDARRAAASEVEPWQFAIGRIALEGVDPETWAPKSAQAVSRRN